MSGHRDGRRSPWTEGKQRDYTRRAIARALPGVRRTLVGFATWLERDRGLTASSVCVRVVDGRKFLHALLETDGAGCVRRLRQLDVSQVERFFVRFAETNGPGARSSMRCSLRRFLQFASERGWVASELPEAVPSWRVYRLAGLPRDLSPKDTRQILASLPDRGLSALRDRALIVLLATYGVRRCQLSGLRLCDVDWARSRIHFGPYKEGKAVAQVLLPHAAEALAGYIRLRRAEPGEDYVFCRVVRPFLRLGPGAITGAVQGRLRRAGLLAPGRGPHAFRHGFATRLLEAGTPLKVVADLLGHRRLESTAVYAKVDRVQLAEAALPWPEVVR